MLVKNLKEKRQWKQAVQYNKNAKPLTPLREGDRVYTRYVGKKWEPGIIHHKTDQPRSFVVSSRDGLYRRNRQDIRPATVIMEQETINKNITDAAPVNSSDLSKATPSPHPVTPTSVHSPNTNGDNSDNTELNRATRRGRHVLPARFRDPNYITYT